MPPTPGPWEWDGKFTVTIPTADGVVPFRVLPSDARLIAAAPDLLAALKALVAEVEACDNPTDNGIAAHSDEMTAARAAIAKAEGR